MHTTTFRETPVPGSSLTCRIHDRTSADLRRDFVDWKPTLNQTWQQELYPLPQCAFKVSMFNVSAIHINSRIWLRSSSTHEPSDPPLRIVSFHPAILREDAFIQIVSLVEFGRRRHSNQCSLVHRQRKDPV